MWKSLFNIERERKMVENFSMETKTKRHSIFFLLTRRFSTMNTLLCSLNTSKRISNRVPHHPSIHPPSLSKKLYLQCAKRLKNPMVVTRKMAQRVRTQVASTASDGEHISLCEFMTFRTIVIASLEICKYIYL